MYQTYEKYEHMMKCLYNPYSGNHKLPAFVICWNVLEAFQKPLKFGQIV